MRSSRYHKALRILYFVFACVLVFDSGVLFPVTKQLSHGTMSFLASATIGVFATVPSNEFNEITAGLTQRTQELNERETRLADREIAARNFETSGASDYSTYIISSILFILTVLIALNYLLDWIRIRNIYLERKTT